MSFPIMNDDVEIIAKLGDEPNEDDGLTAAQLKAKFDEAAVLLKAAHNAIVCALNACDEAGNSGADHIGFQSSVISGSNVKAAVENLRTYLLGQMQQMTQGSVADGGITTEKLDDGAVTAEKVAPGSLLENVTSSITVALHPLIGGTYSASGDLEFYYAAALGIMFVRGTISLRVGSPSYSIFGTDLEFSRYAPSGTGDSTSLIAISDDGHAAVSYNSQTQRYEVSVTTDTAAAVDDIFTVQLTGWYFCDGVGD